MGIADIRAAFQAGLGEGGGTVTEASMAYDAITNEQIFTFIVVGGGKKETVMARVKPREFTDQKIRECGRAHGEARRQAKGQ